MHRLADAKSLDKFCLESHVELCKNNWAIAHLVLFAGSGGVLARPVQANLRAFSQQLMNIPKTE